MGQKKLAWRINPIIGIDKRETAVIMLNEYINPIPDRTTKAQPRPIFRFLGFIDNMSNSQKAQKRMSSSTCFEIIYLLENASCMVIEIDT
jgi:hypothetical protein